MKSVHFRTHKKKSVQSVHFWTLFWKSVHIRTFPYIRTQWPPNLTLNKHEKNTVKIREGGGHNFAFYPESKKKVGKREKKRKRQQKIKKSENCYLIIQNTIADRTLNLSMVQLSKFRGSCFYLRQFSRWNLCRIKLGVSRQLTGDRHRRVGHQRLLVVVNCDEIVLALAADYTTAVFGAAFAHLP